VAQVFLAGKDWRARALLRAQLLEEGVEVEGYETVQEAVAQLDLHHDLPALLIADISSSDHPSADIECLTTWARRLPIWIIASRTSTLKASPEGRDFDMLLYRPVDMGKLVEQIRQRLGRQ